jgi:hypothetical protein
MPNHVHLLLMTGSTPLSRVMQSLLTSYVLYFNRHHDRIGRLCHNRYKSILCDKEDYLLELVRYIHLNPVRAALVSNLSGLKHYPWTGHKVLMQCPKHSWQVVAEVLDPFGQEQGKARQAYESFLEAGIHSGYRKDLEGGGVVRSQGGMWALVQARESGEPTKGDERILGSSEFVEKVLRQANEQGHKLSELRRMGWTFDGVITEASRAVGVKTEDLFMRSRSTAQSQGRALACKWLADDLGMPLKDIAGRFNVVPSAVFRLARRGRIIEKERGLCLSLSE